MGPTGSPRTTDLTTAILLYVLLAATCLIYWPGLSGSFMLDDIPNLSALGDHLYFSTHDRLIAFVLSGHSGPLGRPLSLLSFLIDDFAWPSDPRPFLYTNVLLHLLNGCLVFWLFQLITGKIRSFNRFQSLLVSLLAAAIWLLHPLNVSTVLYIVQRMTELSGLFMLIALVCYLKGREHLEARPRLGYMIMSAGMGVGLVLGALSKETAAALPLFVLALEYTILRAGERDARHQPSVYWSAVFVYLPLAAVLGWHVLRFNSFLHGFELRPFTMGERLLTEPRVLIDYLSDILVPRRAGTGLFHDDIVVSSSLFHPLSTIFAILSLAAALIAAIVWRKKWPIPAFCVLWFLGGHAFEAGIMPLELYFEHRNYLPMLGPAFGIACFLIWLMKGARLRTLGYAATLLFVSLTALATWQNTTLWGNPALLGDVWAREHPRSPRAQEFSAGQWSLHGHFAKAKEKITHLLELRPDATSPRLALVQLNCILGVPFHQSDLDRLLPHLATGDTDKAVPKTLQRIIRIKHEGRCPGLTYKQIDAMMTAVLHNANFRSGRLHRNLEIVYGELAMRQHDFGKTVSALSAAFNQYPEISTAILLAKVLGSGGRYQRALEVLNDPRLHRQSGLLSHLKSRDRAMAELEKRLRNDLARKQAEKTKTQE